MRDERRAAWCLCTADAVTLAAPVSPHPIPAQVIGQLTKQLESRILDPDSAGLGAQVGEQLEGGVVASAAARG